MSLVYSVVLYTGFGRPDWKTFPVTDDPEDAWGDQQLNEVSEYSGGHKYPGSVFVGGVNYLQREKLLALIQKTEWEYPGDVVLIIEDESDERPGIWRFEGKELKRIV